MLTKDQIQALRSPFPSEALSADTSRGFELTSIKAAYVVERLNEVFGLCGIGWRYVHSPFEEVTTDVNGIYIFSDLLPGVYTIKEEQPWAFVDGMDTIGTPGGTTGNDEFSNIVLPPDFDGVDNNFGELGLIPPLVSKSLLTWPLDAWKDKYDGSPNAPLGPGAPEEPNGPSAETADKFPSAVARITRSPASYGPHMTAAGRSSSSNTSSDGRRSRSK